MTGRTGLSAEGPSVQGTLRCTLPQINAYGPICRRNASHSSHTDLPDAAQQLLVGGPLIKALLTVLLQVIPLVTTYTQKEPHKAGIFG